jgi:hypothetical protein
MTAMEIYLTSVKHLPAIERLRLALLILRDITPAELAGAGDASPPRVGPSPSAALPSRATLAMTAAAAKPTGE